MQVQQQRRHSPEEYLELEVHSDIRSEYLDGEIIPMTGGTAAHNQIAGNFYAALNFALKQQPFRVFITDQRIWIPKKRLYTYPDVLMVQGELQFQAGRRDTLTNPLMIAEVLSKSTEGYDRGEKFAAYRTIPCFQEYILINQSSLHIEQFTKTKSRQWLLTEYDGEAAELSLASAPFQIMLVDVYNKIDFEAAE